MPRAGRKPLLNARPDRPGEHDVYFYHRYQHGHPVLNIKTDATSDGRARRELRREDLQLDQSVVSQRKNPDEYPEVTYLGNQIGQGQAFSGMESRAQHSTPETPTDRSSLGVPAGGCS